MNQLDDYHSLIRKYIYSKKKRIQQGSIVNYLIEIIEYCIKNNTINTKEYLQTCLKEVENFKLLTNKELLERYLNDINSSESYLKNYYSELELNTIIELLNKDEISE